MSAIERELAKFLYKVCPVRRAGNCHISRPGRPCVACSAGGRGLPEAQELKA